MSNVYEIVTDRILKLLEQGNIPWRKPWICLNGGAFNRVTGRRYSLLNQLMLSHDGEYASYQQWSRIGGQVRKGAKSETVVFWKYPEREMTAECDSEEVTELEEIRYPCLKYYHVFHVSQVDGVEPQKMVQIPEKSFEPISKAEQVFHDYVKREGITFEQELSDKAFYRPSTDTIHMPLMEQFGNSDLYYSALFHECSHSTGRRNRLNRKGLMHSSFGSMEYSKEELVAEIATACILRVLGIETEDSFRNSTAYIRGWLSALQNDKRMIVSAASMAEKAYRYVLGCHGEAAAETKPE